MNPVLAHPVYVALKASLAAVVALLLVERLGVNDSLSATFVAVVCISPAVYTGLRRGLEQIAASALGGFATWGLTLLLPLPPATALAFGLFATIWICFRVGFGRAFLVGAFTVSYVLLVPGPNLGVTLTHRLASVAIGVASAIALNLIVSLITYRSVFARRMRIARAQVGEGFIQLSEHLRAGSACPALFEDVFALLRALLEELSDAERESRLRGGSTRARMQASLQAVEELLTVSHHGKDLVFLLRRRPAPYPEAAAWARALGEAIQNGRAVSLDGVRSEEAPRQALQLATEAYGSVRSLSTLDVTIQNAA